MLSLGFQVAVAALFGASSDLDAFWIALALPKAIVDSVHLGLLTIVFILIFNEPQSEEGKDVHGELASSVVSAVLAATLVLIPVLMLTAPVLTT